MDYDDHVFKEAVNSSVDVLDLGAEAPNKYVVEEAILFIFALMGIVSNVLLVYVCCYFRKLHTNTNVYLINWAIADSGSALITLTFFRIIDLEIPHEMLCFYVGLAFALIFNEMLFMVFFTVDWCLTAYLPRPLEKFRKYTVVIVAVAWVVAGLYCLASSLLCTSAINYYLIFHISLPIVYVGLLLFVLVLHSIRIVQKIRKKFEYHPAALLTLPTAFVLCAFLSWLNLLFLDLPETFYMLTETPVFLHPTLNLLLLIVVDSDFKVCFFQVLRCSTCPTCSIPKITFQKNQESAVTRDQPISFDNKTFDAVNSAAPNGHI